MKDTAAVWMTAGLDMPNFVSPICFLSGNGVHVYCHRYDLCGDAELLFWTGRLRLVMGSNEFGCQTEVEQCSVVGSSFNVPKSLIAIMARKCQ
jgi:hypothetical protein